MSQSKQVRETGESAEDILQQGQMTYGGQWIETH